MELYKILNNLRKKIVVNQILFSILLFCTVILFLLLITISLFVTRWFFLVLIPISVYIVYKGNFGISIKDIGRKIEQHFPSVHNKLIPVVELILEHIVNNFVNKGSRQKSFRKEQYSEDLICASIDQMQQQIANLDLTQIINYTKTKLVGIIFIILLLAVFFLRIITPQHFSFGWQLIFNPPQKLISLIVTPGDIFVDKDSVVKIHYQIKAPISSLPSELSFQSKKYFTKDYIYETEILANQNINYQIRIKSPIGLTIMKSPLYRIELFKPIEIKEIVFKYNYPAYTKLSTSNNYGSEIYALKGTKVEFVGTTNIPLKNALRIGRYELDSLETRKNEFKGSFTINVDDSFRFILHGADNRQGKSNWYRIRVANDELPFIKMLLPARDIDLPVSMKLLIGMYAVDDFGLSRFELKYTNPRNNETTNIRLKTIINKSEDSLFYLWDLSKVNLLPGEKISYYGVVYDNDAVSGYKSAQTEIYSIRFPTLAEIYDKTTETNQTAIDRLSPLTVKQEQLSNELERLSEHIKKFREMGWEEKSKLQEIINRQEELMANIRALQQEINNVMTDLSQGLILDKETMEQLEKISNILNEILPEEIKQNLEKLKQAILEKNPELSKALENVKLSSEEMKQALQRALELLKKIQQEEAISNLARKAEEIYKQQSQLNERIIQEKLPPLVVPQTAIGKEIAQLQEEMKMIEKNIDDSLIQRELMNILQELTEMQLQDQINNINNSLNNNNRQAAKNNAGNLLKNLQTLKENLKNLADKYKQKQQEIVTTKMIQIAGELNAISQEQEKIKPSQNREDFRELVIRQQRISESVSLVAETLAKWSGQSLFISPKWVQEIARAIINMENAAKLLEEAVHMNVDTKTIHNLQKDAIYSLDIVTLQILRQAMLAQQPAGMKGGLESLLEALSQMTADQMSLGQGIASIPIPIAGGLTAEQLEQLNRLMSLQSQLRSQLEQLLQEINSGNYGDLPGMTGSMQGALEDMKGIEKDLSELNVSRQTIERQEKVIERLLDAQRSIRQKDYSEKRERQIGKNYTERPTIILDRSLGESNKQLREELLRSLREGYPKEYEVMIKNYFELIMQE